MKERKVRMLSISELFMNRKRLFLSGKNSRCILIFPLAQSGLLKKAAAQLCEYFDGQRKEFDLPLSLHGTEFQHAVWKALQTIPAGETRTYKVSAVKKTAE